MAEAAGEQELILISGLGPVTCLGPGLDRLAERVEDAPVARGLHGAGQVVPKLCTVPEFDLEDYIETRRPYLDPHTRCSLAACALALDNARVEQDEVDPARCGLCLGTVFGNVETQGMFQQMVTQKGMRLGSPVLFSHSYPNSTASVLSIEFALKGYQQNFCGDLLCGAQALEAALLALRAGRADVVLAGGADVPGRGLLERLARGLPDGAPPPGQGASFLLLETQGSVERREGFAFCELGSVVCLGPGTEGSAGSLAERLEEAVDRAMHEAEVWDGDVGAVFLCSGAVLSAEAAEAERRLVSRFSQVPLLTMKAFAGETFAAGFPLECTAAAEWAARRTWWPPPCWLPCEVCRAMERISVVILTHNKMRYTRACLRSLLRSRGVELEVLVVDNGSTDGTLQMLGELRGEFERRGMALHWRANGANVGCSTGRNQGLEMAGGAWCAFMDNDVICTDRDWAPKLLAVFAQEERVGLVGPKLVYPFPPHLIQCAGVGISRNGRVQFRGRGRPRHEPEFNRRRECQALISACMVFPRRLYEQIGGLDEAFNPIEYEDLDFCYRARERGWRAFYEPSVEFYHWESITSEGTAKLPNTYLIVKHGMLFKRRWRRMFEREDGPSDEECRWQKIEVPSLEGRRRR